MRTKKTGKATEATSAQPVPEHEAVRQNIPASLQKQVRLRDGNRCTFVSPINGKKCHSSHAIEIDHIIPVARGGTNVLGNLRCLCRTHNQYAAIRIFGEDKMSQYVPDLSSTQSASRFSS